ncbi:MAG: hypothetical protein ABIB79_00860 [archaeon]
MTNDLMNRIERYRRAMLAKQFSDQQNEPAVKTTLESMLTGLKVGEDGGPLVKDLTKSREGRSLLTKIVSGWYEGIFEETKVSDLFEAYSDHFKEELGDDSARYEEMRKVFLEGALKDEKFEAVEEEYGNLLKKLKKKGEKMEEEELMILKKEIDKYQKVVYPIRGYENVIFEELGTPIGRDAYKTNLKTMFEPSE